MKLLPGRRGLIYSGACWGLAREGETEERAGGRRREGRRVSEEAAKERRGSEAEA